MTSSQIGGLPQDLPLPPDDPGRGLTHVQADAPGLERVHLAGGTYTFLVTGRESNGQFCLIDMHVPPGGGPKPHRHQFEELFHLLEGELELTFRGEMRVVRAGEVVNIPANAPHGFVNRADRPARMLCLCAPAGQEEFFRAMGTPASARTEPAPPPDPGALAEMAAKAAALAPLYRTEMTGD